MQNNKFFEFTNRKSLFGLFFLVVLALNATVSCSRSKVETAIGDSTKFTPQKKYSEAELRKRLTPEQYTVTQEHGTEASYSGKYWNNHEAGVYTCIVCNEPLFDSKTKFESGTGWPSFYEPINKKAVHEIIDRTYGMDRTEILCSTCGSHLGHVFDDGPKPTGLRYCMNSASLNFVAKK